MLQPPVHQPAFFIGLGRDRYGCRADVGARALTSLEDSAADEVVKCGHHRAPTHAQLFGQQTFRGQPGTDGELTAAHCFQQPGGQAFAELARCLPKVGAQRTKKLGMVQLR